MNTNLVSPGQSAPVPFGLRHHCLSLIENIAQTLAVLTPSGAISVIIPLIILSAGNGTWLLLLITFSIFLLIMFSVVRFAGLYSSAGSLAAFSRLGLGTRGGLIAGWVYLLGIAYCVPSALLGSAAYFDLLLIPWLGPSVTPIRVEMITGLLTAGCGWAAYRNIKLSTDLMLCIECVSVSLMVLLMLGGMFHAHAWIDHEQMALSGFHFSGLQGGLVLAFILMGGFEAATSLGEEAKDPKKTIPRAIFTCVLPLGVLFLFMTYGIVSLGHHGVIVGQINGLTVPFDSIARAVGLPWLGPVSSLGVALSYFACGLGSLTVASRVLFSMARDGWFWRSFGEAHPRNATPHRAVALICLLSAAVPVGMLRAGMSLDFSINFISQIGSIGLIGGYLLVVVALPIYLKRRQLLRPRDVAVAAGGVTLLLLVLFFSVYPIQPAPYCYVLYVFLASAAAGLAISFFSRQDASLLPDRLPTE